MSASALSYICGKLVVQAKMELTSTYKTINEIAYRLDLEYTPHFNQLFKKCKGCTLSVRGGKCHKFVSIGLKNSEIRFTASILVSINR